MPNTNLSFDIGHLHAKKPHLFADAVELTLLFEDYDAISEQDALSILRQTPRSADEADEDDQGNEDVSSAEITQSEQYTIEECFRQISYRSGEMAGSYPFIFDDCALRLREELTNSQKLYLFLLVASRLRSFGSHSFTARVAGAFEHVSKDAMRKLLSEGADVYLFAANSDDRRSIFDTDLRKALPLLAKKMGMDLDIHWDDKLSSSGDAKIDVVGIHGFEDSADIYHVMIGQCAAKELENDWEKKRYEANLNYSAGIFNFKYLPTSILFIPVCYRQPNGAWVEVSKVSGVIPIDRPRITKLLVDAPINIEAEAMLRELGIA